MAIEVLAEPALRDDAWLAERVSILRQVHFSDVPQGYPITTRFGIRARNRFGSIGARSRQTIILINSLFADPFVPVYVVDGTLAHELAHYAHGYGSGLPLLHRDPHRGGVVDKELEKRGLGEINQRAEQWRERYWDGFYQSRCSDLFERRAAKEAATAELWRAHLERPGSRSTIELTRLLVRLTVQFGSDEPPFRIEWLHASLRQTAPSYWFSKSRTVRLHGLLADPRVPVCVVENEVAYWLACRSFGESVPKIQNAFRFAGLQRTAEEANLWRRRHWNRFRSNHHPLKP
jgi:hypothetical protein